MCVSVCLCVCVSLLSIDQAHSLLIRFTVMIKLRCSDIIYNADFADGYRSCLCTLRTNRVTYTLAASCCHGRDRTHAWTFTFPATPGAI